jgi:hypothetical protein
MKSYLQLRLRPRSAPQNTIAFETTRMRLFARPGQILSVGILILSPLFSLGQTYTIDAVSREISIFNDGFQGTSFEAISREVSVFNAGVYSLDAVSREVSLFNYGYNHLNVSVGSTVVLAGTSGEVPVTVSTLAPVTNLQVEVDFPPNLLTNWSIQPQPPLTGTAFVSNSSRLYATFTPPGGQPITNTQQLGQLAFLSASSQPSAFLPLPVTGATAPMLDGTTFTPYVSGQDGEVVVLHRNSLLRLSQGTNGAGRLTLYGFSGTNYTIESTTNLRPPVAWQPAFTLVPSNLIQVVPTLSFTNSALFFRARQ